MMAVEKEVSELIKYLRSVCIISIRHNNDLGMKVMEKKTLRFLTCKACGICYHSLRQKIMNENPLRVGEYNEYYLGHVRFEIRRKYSNVNAIG